MSDSNLRDELTAIAAQVRPADLHERALARSRQLGRRRGLIGGAFLAGVVVLVVTAGLQLRLDRHSAPLPPATPTVTATSDPVVLLDGTVLQVPEWPKGAGPDCGSGTVPMRGGRYTGNADVVLTQVTPTFLGGELAYLTVIECRQADQLVTSMAVAYRQVSGKSFTLLGKVVESSAGQIVRLVPTATPTADQVSVVISQFPMAGGHPQPEFSAINQTRSYAWDGVRFRQTGGPTDFYVDPASHRIELEPARLRPAAKSPVGCPTWVAKFSVRYSGPAPARDVAVAIIHPPFLVPRSTCTTPDTQGFASSLVPVGELSPGDEKVIEVTIVGELPVDADIQPNPGGSALYTQPRMGDRLWDTRYPVSVENS